jgi:hypothetical protein
MTGPEIPEPTAEEILDWMEGRLDPVRAAQVEEAVARPGSIAHEFAEWAREFHRLAGATPLIPPPPLVGQRLRRMYAAWAGRVRTTARLVARLDVDSREPDALVAVRGPLLDPTTRVQLTFTCEAADVVLDVAPAGPDAVTIRGQVMPRRPTPSAFQATATGPSRTVSTIDGDDLGSFRLERVPVDTELLVLTNDELLIDVPLSSSSNPLS